jgi:hypothetical protein
VSALLALATLQCAYGAQPDAPAIHKKPKMTSTLHKTPLGTYTLTDYPQFTPQEIGERTLALIDSLKSFDELSLERIREVTGFPMMRVSHPGETLLRYDFQMQLPASDWYYRFGYYEDHITKERGGELSFDNPADTSGNTLTDMAPVCLDYDSYIIALEHIGFQKKYSRYHELGWIISTIYARNNIGVLITERREADTPEAKKSHACLKSLGISNWK